MQLGLFKVTCNTFESFRREVLSDTMRASFLTHDCLRAGGYARILLWQWSYPSRQDAGRCMRTRGQAAINAGLVAQFSDRVEPVWCRPRRPQREPQQRFEFFANGSTSTAIHEATLTLHNPHKIRHLEGLHPPCLHVRMTSPNMQKTYFCAQSMSYVCQTFPMISAKLSTRGRVFRRL